LNETEALFLSPRELSSIWEDQLYHDLPAKPEIGNEDDEHENKKVVDQEVENAAGLSSISIQVCSIVLQTSIVG
jgi:hypothetical protein